MPNQFRSIPLRDWVRFSSGRLAGESFHLLQKSFLKLQSQSFLEVHRLMEEKLFRLPDYGNDEISESELTEKIQEALLEVREICLNMSRRTAEWFEEMEKKLRQSWQEKKQKLEWEIQYAGAGILPKSCFRLEKLKRFIRRKEITLQSEQKVWHNFFLGEWSEWRKDLQLQLLRFQTIRATEKLKAELKITVEATLIPQFQYLASAVESALSNLEKEVDSSKAKTILIRTKRNLLKRLREKELPSLMDRLIDTRFDVSLKSYQETIKSNFSKVDKRQSVFRIHDSRSDLPRYSIDTVPFADLMQEEVLQGFINAFQEIVSEIHKMVEQIFRDTSEIDQIIEYNLEGSINLIGQESGEKALETGLEGLRRGINQIEDIQGYLAEKSQSIINALQVAADDLILKVKDLGDAQKVLELRLRWARSRAKKRARQILRQFITGLNRLIPLILEKSKILAQRLSREYGRLRKVTGLGSSSSESPAAYISYLVRAEKRLKSLPYIYQQLFRIEPLTDRHFFAGRESELKKLAQIWSDFNEGLLSRVAISGEKGSGRSTLVYFFKKQLASDIFINELLISRPIEMEAELLDIINQHFKNQPFESLEKYCDFLNEKQERCLLIVENVQYLLKKTMTGFQILNHFIKFLAKLSTNVFVLVTINDYSWRYLMQTQQFHRNFDQHIGLVPLSVEDTESIILKRHRISGFELHFLNPEQTVQARKLKQLASYEKQQEFIRQYFFHQLQDLCQGNITSAIFLWQSAISEVSRETISIRPELRYDSSFLHNLDTDELFLLTAIIQHEKISSESLSEVLMIAAEKTELKLRQLMSMKVVAKMGDDYLVHPLAYRALLRILKTKNFLH
ncbi:MAG TPA: ATP-binding protein [Candidatus Marinimicrobia bacterium]|nr:ATP-binding protein [Candidatus Neomarinimicrobiota bacterium]